MQHAGCSTLQAQCVQGILLGVPGLQQPQAGLSLVADDLATGDAGHKDDDGGSTAAGWTCGLSHLWSCFTALQICFLALSELFSVPGTCQTRSVVLILHTLLEWP